MNVRTHEAPAFAGAQFHGLKGRKAIVAGGAGGISASTPTSRTWRCSWLPTPRA
jgi:hypothetical protein